MFSYVFPTWLDICLRYFVCESIIIRYRSSSSLVTVHWFLTPWIQWSSGPGPPSHESYTLPLSHREPRLVCNLAIQSASIVMGLPNGRRDNIKFYLGISPRQKAPLYPGTSMFFELSPRLLNASWSCKVSTCSGNTKDVPYFRNTWLKP